jgi:hypothetical protein
MQMVMLEFIVVREKCVCDVPAIGKGQIRVQEQLLVL